MDVTHYTPISIDHKITEPICGAFLWMKITNLPQAVTCPLCLAEMARRKSDVLEAVGND